MDIVIQGGMWSGTVGTAEQYSNLPFVNNVIISTWEDEQLPTEISHNIQVLKNKKPTHPGPGNINLQIVSSLEGVKASTANEVMKIRSDQRITNKSFKLIYDFYQSNKNQETLNYLSGDKQKSKIFVIGNNKNYPYHPQDHIYWGYKDDVIKLLDIPLCDEEPYPGAVCPAGYFNNHIRSPMYIGMHYYAKFFVEAKNHVDNWKDYVLDGSTNRKVAMDFYTPIRDKIFQVLPRLDMHWEKYNSGYWYSYEADGEYYAD
tara:strand:+ start:7045 stop:7821 length:777 start_codon:yes stop_codon:yes gene_type:complete